MALIIPDLLFRARCTVVKFDFMTGLLNSLVNHAQGVVELNATIGNMSMCKPIIDEEKDINKILWGFVSFVTRGGRLVAE